MEAQAVAVACAAASAAASGAAASQALVPLPAAGLRRRSLAASVSPALSPSPSSSSSVFRPQAPAAAAWVGPAAPEVACSRSRRCHEVAPMAALAESVAATAAAGDQRAISFVKYQGLGNDFILVDNRTTSEPAITPDDAVRVCDRNFGVGGDGVIFLLPPPPSSSAQYTMRIFNSDGSEPEMCGNGIRCLARFIADVEAQEGKTAADRYVVSTLAGDMVLNLRNDGQVQVDMGEPRLAAAEIPTTLAPTTAEGAVVAAPLQVAGATWNVTCVSMGNPHCITFSSSQAPQGLDVASLPLATIGPQFESHPVFPARINTEFVEVISRNELKMRVWERGAGATLACGTGACALVVAAVLEGRADRSCLVHLPGGPLEIEWREADNRIYMTGPATRVFSGLVHI